MRSKSKGLSKPSKGSAANAGSVFKLSKKAKQTVLYNFTGGSSGAYPNAGLVQDTQGNLHGTTSGAATVQSRTPSQLFQSSPPLGTPAAVKKVAVHNCARDCIVGVVPNAKPRFSSAEFGTRFASNLCGARPWMFVRADDRRDHSRSGE